MNFGNVNLSKPIVKKPDYSKSKRCKNVSPVDGRVPFVLNDPLDKTTLRGVSMDIP